MADFTLVVGVDTSLSFTEMQSGINEIVSKLNANPPKIKVKFDEASLKTMQGQLNALQANINATAGRSPVNTASLSEVAAKAGQATSAVQNMNKAISSTSAAAKSASEAERQLKKIADAATQARALLNKNMEASGSASYQKLNAELTKLETILQTCGGDSTKLSAALKSAGIDGESAVTRLNTAMATLKNELQTTGTQGTASLRQITEMYAQMRAMLNSNPQMAGTAQFAALSAQAAAFRGIIEACGGDASMLEAALHSAGLNGATALETAKMAMASFKAEIADVAAGEEREAAAARAAAEAERHRTEVQRAGEIALRAYNSTILQGENALRGWSAAENSRNQSSREAYRALQDSINAAKAARAAYDGSEGSVNRLRAANENLRNTLKTTEATLKANGDATKSFSEKIGGLAQKFGAWLSVTQVIMLSVRAVRQMVKASVELDSAMTQMQIVTKASASEMEAFGDAAAKVAKRTASTITDVVDSATTYARLGYTMGESTQLAEFTAMLQNVGDIDVSSAQDAITSIVKAFDIDASQIESVMDKLVETGNHFPISVAQIAEGMNNASSSLAAAGNTFDQSVALLTAANTTIQDAAKSSTGLRTIAARIRNTKTELDDLGEVMTQASYEELVQTLTDCGVALTNINGEYRSTYDIMSDIAAKWSDMDSMRQAALATALSGTRQQAVFYSIIEQFQEASGAMDAMANSAGALSSAYDTYLNSAQAHINQFKTAFQELASNIATSGLVKTVVDIGTALLTVINALQKVHLLLPTIVTSIAIIKGVGIARQLAQSTAKVATLSANLIAQKAATDSLAASVSSLSIKEKQLLAANIQSAVASGALTAEEGAQILATLGLTAAEGALTVANKGLAASFKSLMASIPVWGWIALGISVVIEAVSLLTNTVGDSKDKLSELKSEYEEIRSSMDEISKGFRDLNSSVDEIAPRFSELARGVDEFGNNVSLTDEEYAEFLELNNRIAEMFPELNVGMDANGNYMLALSYSADTLTDSLNELVEVQRKVAQQKLADTMPDVLSNIVSTRKELQKQVDSLQSNADDLAAVYQKLMNGGFQNGTITYDASTRSQVERDFAESALLQQLGVTVNKEFKSPGQRYATFAVSYDFDIETVTRNYENAMAGFNRRIALINAEMEDSWANLNPVISAWMSTDYDYNTLSAEMQQLAIRMASNLDFSSLGLTTAEDVQQYIIDNVIHPVQDLAPEVQQLFSDLVSVDKAGKTTSEYISEIQRIAKAISDVTDYSMQDVLELTGQDKIIQNYIDLANDIKEAISGATEADILSLSPEEMLKAFDIIKLYGIQTWDDLQSALANKTFDIVVDFSTESENFTKLNTALSQAASATGLTSESVEVLTQRYAELEGFDPASLFEHTTTGIHLNARALNELESEYQAANKTMLDNKLEDLVERYKNLTDAINDETDAAKKMELYAQRDAILAEINDTKDLISQYNGLTSAYNRWLQAKSRTDEREGYKNIGEGYTTIGDLIEQGWVNDSEVNEYLNLLLAADARTKDNIADFERLSQTIEGTHFSIMDFFQYDEDNNLVSDGLFNFLDAVREKLGDDFVQIREDGAYAFDFTGDKIKQVAEALGMSEEAVQLLERAMIDAGFDVIFDSTFSDIDAVIGASKDAIATLKELKDAGKIESEIDFDFGTTSIEDAATQIENAKKLLQEFTSEDGTVNLELEGATEAATVLATLIYRKSDLEAPAIMSIVVDTEMAQTEVGAAISLMQEFKEAVANLEVQTALGVDTTDAQAKVDSLLGELQGNQTITGTLEIDTSSVDTAVAGINATTPEMLVTAGLDSSEVDNYDPENLERTVTFKRSSSAVDSYISYLKNLNLNKTVTITYRSVGSPTGTSRATGTAHARGTAMLRGYWGARDSGVALGGELGQELVVRDGSFFTIGDDSAEMFRYKKGDIIFNAEQTRQILQNGRIASGGKRGYAYAWGTAFDSGSGGRPRPGSGGGTHSPVGGFSGSGSSGASGSGKTGGSSKTDTSKSDEESWFEKQYKLHNHLIKMCQEDMEDYLAWLNTAYQQAYDEGIIDLDEYRKYQEEVYEGIQDLFKDYLSDVEHEIDMRSQFDGESAKIISLYKQLIMDVEKEIAAARAAGLDDTDDYIQELQKKWAEYGKSVKEIEEDARDGAKDAVDELIEYRIKMLKQEADKEKDSLKKKLDNLKEFYDKQKEMLQDVYDEEKYLDEQSEKRKSVTDIQAELDQLEFDDSAWAQKRKLQLQQELADAQKELEDFEKQHALDEALGLLDDAYDAQEKEINAEMEALEEKLNDPEALYNQALADIRNNTEELYQEMLEYNRRHGTGNDEDVTDMWEAAYKALLEYHDINGEWYKGINLGNYTGYEKPQESWDTAPVSEPGSQTQPTQPSAPETPTLTDSIKKHVAAAIWNGNYGWGSGSTRANRLTEVFGSNNGIQAIVNKGYQYVAGTSPSGYSYTDMRKKFNGYASGTRKAAPGMHAVDELGAEYLFTSADGNRYRVFSGGEKVLNAKATEFLYEFANSGKDILEKIAKSFMDTSSLDRIQPIVNNNEIHMGDITIQGNADRATVSEIRRAQRESLETMLREFNRLNR